jgi:hypothetical protein
MKAKKIPSNKTLSNILDIWAREEYDVAIVNHLKSEKTRCDVFPGLLGMHYNDDYFTVSENEGSINNQPRNVKINQIIYYDNTGLDFFEKLLPLFYVPFVRNNMLSAKPFPFKYLDEWIKQQMIISSQNKTTE